MALIRFEPARELASLQSEMNQLFSTFFGDTTGPTNGQNRRWIPAMDLVETQDHFVVRADLPGVTEEDISIELEDNVLTISGERKLEEKAEKEGYFRVERSFGRFARTLTLPDGVDAEAIDAQFDSGVLEVRIPKPEQRKPRKVAIGVGGKQPAIEGAETTKAEEGDVQKS
jgi:HSP20 family protein